MKSLRSIQQLFLIIITLVSLAACTTAATEEESLADSVAQTLTAAPPPTEAPDANENRSTEATDETFPGDLQPLTPEECEQLAAFMVNRLPVPPVEQDIVPVERQGETGDGCRAIAVGTGEVFPDMMVVEDAMRGIVAELGWTEDPTAPTCLGTGGWGPGASSTCFTQADGICELFVHVDPASDDLCSGDEPISVCFERLAPEQLLYTIELTCARDASPSAQPLESDLMRIEFETGAIQTLVYGDVAAGGIDHYVLTAMEGQTMTLNLRDRTGEMIAYDSAVLVIWGADGTVLISDHADALTWSGELPLTQDYYIDVKSISGQSVPYTLEVVIPPS